MTIRKFRVTVDGETFEVEVEDLGQAEPSETAATAVPAPPVSSAAPHPGRPRQVQTVPPEAPAMGPAVPSRAAAAAAPGPGVGAGTRAGRTQPAGGERVDAPLPGTIVSVVVQPGQQVKAGAVLVVLEAMKMQNEIVSPRDGKVREVVVGKGDSVAVGDPLVTLE